MVMCLMMWYSSLMPLPPSMSLQLRAMSRLLPQLLRLIMLQQSVRRVAEKRTGFWFDVWVT